MALKKSEIVQQSRPSHPAIMSTYSLLDTMHQKNTEEAKGVALENPQKSCKNPGVAEHVCKSSTGDKEIGRSLEFTDQQV